jgi:hypothetical protein
MLPMSLLNIVAAGIWHFMGTGPGRWVACSALILGVYAVLGRGLMADQKLGKRIYRFAE